MSDFTPRSDTDLCKTCAWAHIRESYSGKRTVLCKEDHPSRLISEQVVKCNEYRHKNQPDTHELEKIAWIITSDVKGKVGFRPWKDMSQDERDQAGVRRT